jgi:Family of unknown function (DUF6178)
MPSPRRPKGPTPKAPEKKPAPATEPDNVVALSRYRAQLGRGRKLRRADALLEGPEPERAVRALPGDEFYYVVHETGLRDASDILLLARPEQVRTALDFALWERDQIVPARAAEWLEALAEAPYETIGEWVAGLDVELFALLLRKSARIYDLTQEEPPEEPEGRFYPTPDSFFVLDVIGFGTDEVAGVPGAPPGLEDDVPPGSALSVMRIVDSLYRADKDFARRLLVGARAELDSELEELAFRWRQGRMADLGFADHYEALEVYRELDPASVRLGEVEPGKGRVRPLDERESAESPMRAPTALVERLTRAGSPFARATQGLKVDGEIADLHFALVALTNRVLAADRVTPGDDAAIAASLERLLATLDLGVELLARGEPTREIEAVRTVPLVRLFRLGVSLVGKLKRLATTLRREGPFAATGLDLTEREDAPVLEAVGRTRPDYAGALDDPPAPVDRPFRTLADLARAAVVIERAAAAQALLVALGVKPGGLTSPSGPLATAGVDAAAIDAGVLARTVLVGRLLAPKAGRATPPPPLEALSPKDVRDFEALLERSPTGAPKLPEVLRKKALALFEAATPAALVSPTAPVRDRWLASLAPLEPVLVRPPKAKPRTRKS